MGFIVPILMCLAFIFAWIFLTKGILALDKRLMKKSLVRSARLDMKSTAALLSLYFGEKTGRIFLYDRWFPRRSPQGTLYEEIPCILVFGKKIFVLEICSLPGFFQNTGDEFWSVTPPPEYGKKKDVRIKNPLLQAQSRATLLSELLEKIGYSSDATVEAMVIFTDQAHRLADPEQKGLYTTGKALSYLGRFAPKTKGARKRMKRENGVVFDLFGRYSLSEKRALAKNNKIRRKKQ